MRYQLFKLFNALIGTVSGSIMRRTLNATYHHPEIAELHSCEAFSVRQTIPPKNA